MRTYLKKRSGNIIIVVMLVGTLVVGGLQLLVRYSLESNKSSIQALKTSEGATEDTVALSFLSEKFQLKGVKQTPAMGPRGPEIVATFFDDSGEGVPPSGDQHPYLFVEPYPSVDELSRPNFKPVVGLFRPYPGGAQLNPNLQTTSAPIRPIYLPLVLVEGRRSEGTGVCESLPKPITRFMNQVERLDCKVNYFSLDTTRLMTLENPRQISSGLEDFQRAFLGFPKTSLLSMVLSKNFMGQTSFNFPLEAIDNKLVSFIGVFPDPIYPRVLKNLMVKVGSSTALLEMPVPPEPEAIFELAKGQSEPINLGNPVQLSLKTNSITISGSYADNQAYRNPVDVAFPRQSARNIQKYAFHEQVVVNLSAPRNLYTDPAFGGPQINPSNDREGQWIMKGKVQGLKGATYDFSKSIRVYPPPKPDCTVSFGGDRYREGGKELLQGETLTISLDCNRSSSGHVDYASIGGIPVSNFDNNPASPTYKKGSVVYSRRNLVAAENIVAIASGPGGTWSDAGSLNLSAVCPFNDFTYTGHFSNSYGHWPFSRLSQLSSGYMLSEAGNWSHTGSWIDYNNYGAMQSCDRSTGFCMETKQAHSPIWSYISRTCYQTCSQEYKDANGNVQISYYSCNPFECGFSSWIDPWTTDVLGNTMPEEERLANVYYSPILHSPDARGRAVWVEVGDRRISSCAPRKYAYRTRGCFTAETRITMADGKEKNVSEIAQNDFILNPLYNAPIRVSKIVKGPEKKPLYQLEVNNKKLTVTEDHPFLTRQGWVRADSLKRNDMLLGDGEPQKITLIKKLGHRKPIEVYNFELDSEWAEAHLVKANGIPSGDLTVQTNLKKNNQVP